MNVVTSSGWSVSSCSGGDIKGAILHVYRRVNHNGKLRNGELDGRLYPSSDAAHQAAFERGYTKRYYSRPTAFIHVRLSPATRRYLLTKTVQERRELLKKITEHGSITTATYFRQVMTDSCMRPTRDRWDSYMAGENPESQTKWRKR